MVEKRSIFSDVSFGELCDTFEAAFETMERVEAARAHADPAYVPQRGWKQMLAAVMIENARRQNAQR